MSLSTSSTSTDTQAPIITEVVPPADGFYRAEQTLRFEVRFSEPVIVTGTVVLPLNLGGTEQMATCTQGSGTDALTFTYVIQSGDDDEDGIACAAGVDAQAGTVEDAAGNQALLDLLVPDLSLVRVDTVAPQLTTVIPPLYGRYRSGMALDFDIGFSEPVYATGTVTIDFTITSGSRQATLTAGNGTQALVFRYVVQEGDAGDTGVMMTSPLNTSGGGLADAAGNPAQRDFVVPDTHTVLVGPGPVGARVASISAGKLHTCVVMESGQVACWGSANNSACDWWDCGAVAGMNRLGSGVQIAQSSVPVLAQGIDGTEAGVRAAVVGVAGNSSCAVSDSGGLYCWGSGENYQLGTGNTQNTLVPVAVSSTLVDLGSAAGTARSITGGGHQMCFSMRDGSLRCGGYAGTGRLGIGGSSGLSPPNVAGLVLGIDPMSEGLALRQASMGVFSMMFILENGSMWATGEYANGRNGTGYTTNPNSPGGVNWTAYSAVPTLFDASTPEKTAQRTVQGPDSGCVLDANHALQCFGANGSGQAANGTTTSPVLVPSAVEALDGTTQARTVVDISAGYNHYCAVTATMAVFCWGANAFGQLGQDPADMNQATTPVQVLFNAFMQQGHSGEAVAIACGDSFSCAVMADGRVACWGRQKEGRLGDGVETDTFRYAPAHVLNMEGTTSPPLLEGVAFKAGWST